MEFSLEQVRELVTILNKTDITELTLESGDVRLSIRKSENRYVTALPSDVAVPQTVSSEALTPSPVAHTTTIADALPTKKLFEITSPMVGTFYRSPAPDEAPFVELGDIIKKGGAVCIIEAMKLMNEIECETSGKIVEILVDNTQPVEYGQVLMRVEVM